MELETKSEIGRVLCDSRDFWVDTKVVIDPGCYAKTCFNFTADILSGRRTFVARALCQAWALLARVSYTNCDLNNLKRSFDSLQHESSFESPWKYAQIVRALGRCCLSLLWRLLQEFAASGTSLFTANHGHHSNFSCQKIDGGLVLGSAQQVGESTHTRGQQLMLLRRRAHSLHLQYCSLITLEEDHEIDKTAYVLTNIRIWIR